MPTPTPSPTNAPPTASPTPSATPSTEPRAIYDPYELPIAAHVNRAILNNFWRQVIQLSCVELVQEDDWHALSSMTSEVELVIVGHPVSAEWRADDFEPIVDMAVDEVIKGSPVYAAPGVIQLAAEDWWYQIEGAMPAVPTILFLRNVGVRETRYGYPVSPGEEFLYYLPSVYQNAFAEFRGRVFVPLAPRIRRWVGEHEWPLSIKGMPFEQFLAQVRRAAHSGHGPGTTSGSSAAC